MKEALVTGEQMCETIRRAMLLLDPEARVDTMAIWNASPAGELWHVFELYSRALIYLVDKGVATEEERLSLESIERGINEQIQIQRAERGGG